MTTFRKDPTKVPITAAIGMIPTIGIVIVIADSEKCSEPISCIQVRWHGCTVVTCWLRVKRGSRRGMAAPPSVWSDSDLRDVSSDCSFERSFETRLTPP